MSIGLYTHISKPPGTIVSAPMYNGAHKNHQINDIPTSAGARSDDVTQYRAITDPAPAGTPTPVVDLGTELEQLRFVLRDIKTALNGGVPPTWWYTPVSPDATDVTAHGARVNRSIAQSIPNNTQTPIIFNTVQYDTGVILPGFDPFFSIGTPTRLTARATGLYAISAFGQWATGGGFAVFVRVNGLKILAASQLEMDGAVGLGWMHVSSQTLLNQNDYVEFVVFQSTGAPLNFTGADFALELLTPSQAISPVTTFTLTVSESGNGAGTIVSSPPGINSPGSDFAVFVSGTVVQLTATATSGGFAGWTGDVPIGHEMDNPLSVTMDQDRFITAIFSVQGAFITTGATVGFTGTNYFSLTSYIIQVGTSGAEAAKLPVGITLKSMWLRLGAAIPSGCTVTARFYINGVASNAIVVTMTSSDFPVGKPVAHTNGTLAVSAGDTLSVEVVTTGSFVGSIVVNAINVGYEP